MPPKRRSAVMASNDVEFRYYAPDRDKHPGVNKRGLRVDYKDVEVTVSWQNDSKEDLVVVAESMPIIMRQVALMEENSERAYRESRALDSELEAFFKDEGNGD
jgi:hypothetical protein